MPNFEAVNGVTAANLEACQGVSKANVEAINGCSPPTAAGATLWTVVHDDTTVSTAANSDTTSWTAYDSISGNAPSGSVDHIAVHYGQNGSGAARYVCSFEADNAELAFSDDPSNGNAWTVVQNLSNGNTIPCRLFDLAWGNGVWLGIGQMTAQKGNNVLRSTDGSSWTAIDVSGVSGIIDTGCYGIAYSGSGSTFYFAQQNRIYKSTDGGQNWSLAHTLLNASNADPGDIRGLFVTNSSIVAWVDANPAFLYSCALSDDTDWNTGTQLSTGANVNLNTKMGAAAGRFVAVHGKRYWAADIAGKSITLEHDYAFVTDANASFGNVEAVAGDGTGKWIGACLTGDIVESTDNADSWTLRAENVGSKNAEDVTANVYAPI